MQIEKKILKEYFEPLLDGQKSYEWRLGDFDIKEGDTLVLNEWNNETETYTGRSVRKRVGTIGRWKPGDPFWTQEDINKHGFQVISLLD